MAPWYKIDPITGETTEVGSRIVVCTTPDCENNGKQITVADDGGQVTCGPCGTVLAEDVPV